MRNIRNILKDKKAISGSVEYVVYFGLIIMLVFLIIQILFGVFTVFTTNVAASNVARVISVDGGFDNSSAEEIYNIANNQLKNHALEDSVQIVISDDDDTVILSADNLNKSYRIGLGETFEVTVTSRIVLFTVAGRDVDVRVSSSSAGVGEVYLKND